MGYGVLGGGEGGGACYAFLCIVETVVQSWKFHREDTSHSGFAGLAPDGAPVFTQIYKDFDVSAIQFEIPR